MTEPFHRQRVFLQSLYGEAVRAAQPAICLPPHLPPPPKGRLIILAIGKAAASMAAAAETHYAEHWPGLSLEGLALTRYGHAVPTKYIEVIEAAHPVPDKAGLEASKRLLSLAHELGEDDLALVLLSGGGSALAVLPIEGVTLEDKRMLTQALLKTGAPIADINTIRKHFSLIKGGRLAEALAPARSLTLAISDVAGDDPHVIASGPSIADPSTKEDAAALLDRYGIALPPRLVESFSRAAETPKPRSRIFAQAEYRLIASGALSLAAAERMARAQACQTINLGDRIEGEAQSLAARHAKMALEIHHRPTIILSGGEAAVSFGAVTPGIGGPNQEYALALALALQGASGVSAIAADTDGIDGGSGKADDPAGAMIFPDTLSRADRNGLHPGTFLAAHDSGRFFSSLGDLLRTGPSFTNVNDFRAILIESQGIR